MLFLFDGSRLSWLMETPIVRRTAIGNRVRWGSVATRDAVFGSGNPPGNGETAHLGGRERLQDRWSVIVAQVRPSEELLQEPGLKMKLVAHVVAILLVVVRNCRAESVCGSIEVVPDCQVLTAQELLAFRREPFLSDRAGRQSASPESPTIAA